MDNYCRHIDTILTEVEQCYGIQPEQPAQALVKTLASSTIDQAKLKEIGSNAGIALIPASFISYRLRFYGLHVIDFSLLYENGMAGDVWGFILPFCTAKTVTEASMVKLNELIRVLMKLDAIDPTAINSLAYRLIRAFIVTAFRSHWSNTGVLAELILRNLEVK